MKSVKIILILIVSFVQAGRGQTEANGFEKLITTIEYFGNRADTTYRRIAYDVNGIQNVKESEYVSHPVKIDTIHVSANEILIVHTWRDGSKTSIEEIHAKSRWTKIGIDQNGIDTIYFLDFQFGKNGLPLKGIIVNQGDTIKYEVNEKFSMEEINEIETTLRRDSEFIYFSGTIQFQSRKKILITELEEARNTLEIRLNKKLKPKMIIKKEWHEYHKMIFVNKYSYKYRDDNLVEIKNVDMYGDLEMKRTIDYRFK